MMIQNNPYNYGTPPPGYTYDATGNLIPLAQAAPAPTSSLYPPGYIPPATGAFSPTDPNYTPPNPTEVTPPGSVPAQNNMTPPAGMHLDPNLGQYVPNAPAPTSGGGGGGGGSFGGGIGAAAGAGSAPTPFDWPTFTPPTPVQQQGLQAPPAFDPGAAFAAPTLAEAQAQPGYQFGLNQGLGAIQNSAAAAGTLRGGGTLKSLFDYGNAAAEQNYGNVYSQDANTYNTNLGTKLAAYNTNWGTAKDVNSSQNAASQANYANAYQNAAGAFNPKFAAASASFSDMYQRWLAGLNANVDIFNQGGT